MKIINIVGARPNFMKIAPIMRQMKNDNVFDPILLHTGQHYDVLMSENFFSELKIPKPDIYLGVGSNTHAKQVAAIMDKFDDICEQIKPDVILVVGDVNSTMACSLVASKKGIKIVHVEAGIRSFDRTMPEEINRLVTDSLADLLLPPSKDAVENLKKEGHDNKKIELVGNIMIDTLFNFQKQIHESKILVKLGIEEKSFATITLHRPSNVDSKADFYNILKAIEYVQNYLKVVFPVHPRTQKMIERFRFKDYISRMKNLIIIEPLGYFDFSKLVAGSRFVFTDSGGIQEETTVLQIPCITLRDNTERPITISEGTNELAGSDTEKIIGYVNTILNGEWKKGIIPALWDGKTTERIIKRLKKPI